MNCIFFFSPTKEGNRLSRLFGTSLLLELLWAQIFYHHLLYHRWFFFIFFLFFTYFSPASSTFFCHVCGLVWWSWMWSWLWLWCYSPLLKKNSFSTHTLWKVSLPLDVDKFREIGNPFFTVTQLLFQATGRPTDFDTNLRRPEHVGTRSESK